MPLILFMVNIGVIPNPSTAVAVSQGYWALVKLEGPTPHQWIFN